jgi:hypothetical protein
LKGNNYASFQELVNKAIVLDNERREMDRKRKMKGQGVGNNNRQCTNSQHGFHQKFQGPVSQWNHNPNQKWSQNWQNSQSQQRPSYQQRQQYQQNGQQTSRTGNSNATPMKNSAPNTPTRCYVCGKEGHMSYHCPEKQNQQTPQSQKSNQRQSGTGRVNHVSSDTAHEAP